MQWSCNALGKHIDDVVVSVGPTIEFCPKCILPFLSLDLTLSSGRMEDEPFELHFADAFDFGPYFERQITVGFIGVGEFDEPYLGIEIRTDFPPFENPLQPVRAISQ